MLLWPDNCSICMGTSQLSYNGSPTPNPFVLCRAKLTSEVPGFGFLHSPHGKTHKRSVKLSIYVHGAARRKDYRPDECQTTAIESRWPSYGFIQLIVLSAYLHDAE
ncbi:hypothetical protein GDO78_017561 [Eleutherodactylus coqui]|uniref:Uncharacterized protein n=1 Tax=Eleutherodactylus coqui TaxID=57060 RepID=A0A8J6BCW0_ELECQ|nr:hypothetical protein GDO78_017561 [Eleutherodactylus coqui]